MPNGLKPKADKKKLKKLAKERRVKKLKIARHISKQNQPVKTTKNRRHIR